MNTQTSELFVAIRCEELPASMVRPALEGLKQGLLSLISGVEHGDVRVWATPRRLAVAVQAVPSHSPTRQTVVTGPPADRAFDADGKPTKTGIGFARGKGASPEDLTVVELPKRGKVAALTLTEGGEVTTEAVLAGLPDLIANIPFKKSMRWADGDLRFGRPLHGIVVTYAGAALTREPVHGVPVLDHTIGHRLSPDPIAVTDSITWLEGLRAHHVEPDLQVRAGRIAQLLTEATTTLGSDPIVDADLAEEVLHLVEWPMLVLGAFDEDLLALPPRLLVTSMKVHQRYFPVYRDGALSNDFVIISNNPTGDADLIAAGNARVLRARFYDARFFLAEDRKKRLEEHGAHLPRMRWIRGLGTVADKGKRLMALAAKLAALTGADPTHAGRAAALSKTDLATQMVGEFPELQGHVGRLYAAQQGEPDAVAVAIEEHYLPKFAGDATASSPAGQAVALADRLDTLAAAFGIGLAPKGGDPQGLRRAAVGLVQTLLAAGLRVSLADLFGMAIDGVHAMGADGGEPFDRWQKAQGTGPVASGREALVAELVQFTLARFKALHTGAGRTADVVDAALAAGDGTVDDVLQLDRKVRALHDLLGSSEAAAILQTFKRVLNISADSTASPPAPGDCGEAVERDLLAAADAVADTVANHAKALDYTAALTATLPLQAPVTAFFDGVMVNADDPAVAAVRLGVLRRVGAIFADLYDFRRLSTR